MIYPCFAGQSSIWHRKGFDPKGLCLVKVGESFHPMGQCDSLLEGGRGVITSRYISLKSFFNGGLQSLPDQVMTFAAKYWQISRTFRMSGEG